MPQSQTGFRSSNSFRFSALNSILVSLVSLNISAFPQTTNSSTPAVPPAENSEIRRGAGLARVICQTCHLFPDPALLDKTTWEREALPFMNKWLGITRMNLDLRPGREYVEAAGVFPKAPLLSLDDWKAICSYYLDAAPAKPLPQAARPRTGMGLKEFEVILPEYRFQVPLTTLIKIDPQQRGFFLGDAGTKTLNFLDGRGNLKFSLPVDSSPVQFVLKDDTGYLTLIGSVTPSDEPQGKVVQFKRDANGLQKRAELAVHLTRPTDTEFADLNGDGKEDFVVCGFGNYVGRFSWFENIGDGKYREHVLFDRPGAVKACTYDFDKDGLQDIVVMMAQGREGIYLFTNQGHGSFTAAPIVEYHPAFGSSHFELVDFNGDGFMDLLATNGDNGEYASPLKNYHGIRLYLNDGKNHFREAFFFPLNGAYKAMPADFDADGDLDIAAISFFPDYDQHPEESFVYLENKGNLEFTSSSFPDCQTGRWLTMDVNDLDGDGRPDIVLGSFIRGPNKVPSRFSDYWETMGSSFLILRNVHSAKK